MTRTFFISIPGKPVAKGRARVNFKTKREYPDEKTAVYENLVKLTFQEAYPDHDLITGAVTTSFIAYFPIPKSWSKKKQELARSGKLYMTAKPDIDNLEKSIYDGLKNVAWKDDDQIVRHFVSKDYSDRPRVDMFIHALEETEEDDGDEPEYSRDLGQTDQRSGTEDH